MNAARGATIAYQQALRWKIEQDDEYAAKAVENLNKWVQTCVGVTGNTNLSLAAGLYGYEFAIAGELLRDYEDGIVRTSQHSRIGCLKCSILLMMIF